MTSPSSPLPSPSPADPSWLPRQRDALMLANLLRVSRLTLLYGEAGAGKSSLLKNELLALLRRRATDGQPERAGLRVVIPFPERRHGARAAGQSEVAVFFDGWHHASPLAALKSAVEAALDLTTAPHAASEPPLADTLLALGRRHKARLLVILDGFEQHLHAGPDDEAAQAFGRELVEALNHPDTPAHFFISVRDDAQPLLAPWRAQVAGFGDRWLRIRHWQTLRPAPAEASAPGLPGSDMPLRSAAESAPRHTDAAAAAPVKTSPTLVHPAPSKEAEPDLFPAAATVPVAAAAMQAATEAARMPATQAEAAPEAEQRVDLYLPLDPPAHALPSMRVQALWDELLVRPAVAALAAATATTRLAPAMPAAPAESPAGKASGADTEAAPITEAPEAPDIATPPLTGDRRELLPRRRRTPWMLWSLLVVAFAAILIYTWGDSLRMWPKGTDIEPRPPAAAPVQAAPPS